MAYKILSKLGYSVATNFSTEHFLATPFNHLSLRMSFGSNMSFNYASAMKGWLRMQFFIPLVNNIISTLN